MTAEAAAGPAQTAIRMELESDLGAVRLGVERVLEFLRLDGLGEDLLSACELALVEACNNAVEHAVPQGDPGSIALEVVCGADVIAFRVEDHTQGFTWPESPELPPDDAEHGRGLFLIHSLMDSVEYLRGRTHNMLVMRKARGAEDSGVPRQGWNERVDGLRARLSQSDQIIRDMADELSSCYESLSAIFRYSGERGGSESIADFTHRLLGDLLQVTKMMWYVVRLQEPVGGRLVCVASSEHGVFWRGLVPGTGGSIEVRAVEEHRDIWFEKVSELVADDPLLQLGESSYGLVHPLFIGDEFVGTLAIGGVGEERRLTAAQTSVVQTFGDFLAIHVVNSRFHEARVQNLLVAQELEIAKKIQSSLLPATLPHWPGVHLAGRCESAREVGGDFFDIVSLGSRGFLVIVSDVMGKGLPAAMFAMVLRSLLRALSGMGEMPSRMLGRANELLYEELSRVDMFITAQVVHVDVEGGAVTLANAGHCPLLACNPGGEVCALSPEGMPLGVLEGAEFEEEKWVLEPGGRVLVYTDGLTETPRSGGEFFGQERLEDWLRSAVREGADAEVMCRGLVETLRSYQDSTVLLDDQTFVVIGR
jgi:serine phosphatase RsbU (regulator of sigma subunit)/anti-sigma regulatory factor (Ser/Thr protein kinase)